MCLKNKKIRLGDAQNLQGTLKICYLGVPGTLKVQGQWGPLLAILKSQPGHESNNGSRKWSQGVCVVRSFIGLNANVHWVWYQRVFVSRSFIVVHV